METTGRLKSITKDWQTDKLIVSFEIDSRTIDADSLQNVTLDIIAKKQRKHRSLNANALLWSCLGKIAGVLKTDKWSVYLQMLKDYGEYTYVCVKPQAVEMLKRQWRECEELGPIMVNGTPAVQMLCYYGSSTYDSKQFSRLLDGVISEMAGMGLETPSQEELRRVAEEWGRQYEQAKVD